VDTVADVVLALAGDDAVGVVTEYEDRLAGLLCDRDHGGLDHGVPPARLDPRAHQRCVAIEQRCRRAPRSRAAHSWAVTTACVRRRRCMRVWVT